MLTEILTAERSTQSSERVARTATFHVQSHIQAVFPLFGPIREKEWAAGWNPEIIYSNHPEIEQQMVFKTSGKHTDEPEYLWIVSNYQPEKHRIEYTVSTANRVWFITVQCEAELQETSVTVTYSYTGLNAAGNQRNKEMLEQMFADDLQDWKVAINHYLHTGRILE